MKEKPHHIRTQQVDLNFETEKKARYWNNRFSDFYYGDILPQFSSLLDEVIPDDRSYVIDRLEIDLGTIQMDEFRTAFLEQAEKELKRVLQKNVGSGLDLTDNEDEYYASRDNVRKGSGESEKNRNTRTENLNNLQVKDRKEHLLESFYYFLDHGVLPWNSEVDTIEELETNIYGEIGVDHLTTQHALQERMNIGLFRRRFYFQFSGRFVDEIFNRFFNEERDRLLSLKKELEEQLIRLAQDASSREKISKEFSQNIWSLLIADGPTDMRKWPKYYVRSIIENLSDLFESSKDGTVFESLWDEASFSFPLAAYLRSIIDEKDVSREGKRTEAETQTDDDGTQPSTPDQKGLSKKPSKDKHEAGDDESSMDEVEDRNQKLSEKKKATDELYSRDKNGKERTGKRDEPDGEHGTGSTQDEKTKKQWRDSEDVRDEKVSGKESFDTQLPDESLISSDLEQNPGVDADKEQKKGLPDLLEEYYVRNAGIVLCWPYLSRLFKNLEYLDDQTFKEPTDQQRAVHLLGYLGSGTGQCEEHELVLDKFLAAWPLNMPIIRELELTENEKNNADEMLNSLISHWSVLKNTTVEGLRESFFNREGKLFKENEQWRLVVEQESYDMLLDQLPFSISIIKLPWMKEVLKVDWA